MASAEPRPVAPDEAATLFAPLRGRSAVALAVSGGADSLALLHLWVAARALDPDLPRAIVLTVDHGLRAAAAAEAAEVARIAGGLGLAHRTLLWTGEKPTSGLQAAARAARRRLLLEAARREGCDTLLLAHHADDQAETFLSRLARGSGVVGLAGMAAHREEDGVLIARPLLDLPKARLEATLAARGVAWIEDPSNRDVRFERARLRAAAGDLAALGLTRERLVGTAAAMARAAAALDLWVDDLTARAVDLHAAGWAEVDLALVRAAPEEIRLRLLARLVVAVGGRAYAPTLEISQGFDRDVVSAPGEGRVVRTAAGVRVERRRGRLWLALEVGRADDLAIDLAPGENGRFAGRSVHLSAAAAGVHRISVLGDARRAVGVPRGGEGRARPSPAIVESAVAVFSGGRPVACPGLGWGAVELVDIAPPTLAAGRWRGAR